MKYHWYKNPKLDIFNLDTLWYGDGEGTPVGCVGYQKWNKQWGGSGRGFQARSFPDEAHAKAWVEENIKALSTNA